jgi:SAM-dependent methyltransferase
MSEAGDYVLGTHDDELERLGLQHRVWRPTVLECWRKAGITTGKRVLDVGAGPGYAATDLAEIVGPTGDVVAVERSPNFIRAVERTIRERDLKQLHVQQLDLMTDDLPRGQYDFSWCRWVLCFVSDPALLVNKLAGVMRKGGKSIFHEYAHYTTWRYLPPLARQEEFRRHVVASWRESGGEPDAARVLPDLLGSNGFVIRTVEPHIFAVRPDDYFWQWPATFIDVYLPRLQEMGRIDQPFIDAFRRDMAEAEKSLHAMMITPLVLEIVAEKVS